jgi:hypothetical protein
MERMDIQYKQSRLKVASLPFMICDTTAGSESELQSAVAGSKHNVDLPTYIEQSNYFENIIKRAKAGDTQKKIITGLEKYLNNHQDQIWENSWVWFPRKTMSSFAECTFQRDLYADKDDPLKGQRNDFHQFIYCKNGEDFIRIPVSYLLKLSLAQVISSEKATHPLIYQIGYALLQHFLNETILHRKPIPSKWLIYSLKQAWAGHPPEKWPSVSCLANSSSLMPIRVSFFLRMDKK